MKRQSDIHTEMFHLIANPSEKGFKLIMSSQKRKQHDLAYSCKENKNAEAEKTSAASMPVIFPA